MEKKKIGAGDFLALALYAFAGFGLEILLSMLLPSILGVEYSDYSIAHHCIHLALTCVLWGTMIIFLIRLSKKGYSYDIFECKEIPNRRQWLGAVGIAVLAILITTVLVDGFKPVQEYNGIVKFIFQNIYYLFETALIVLTIAFGQKFGDMITKREKFPSGGLFLALTWGLVHILTQSPLTGIYTFSMAVLYGIVYLLLKKNARYSFILIAIMFIL